MSFSDLLAELTLPSMHLNALPADLHRLILAWLDFRSIVRLFSTFDRSVQRTLSAPGAIDQLAIDGDANLLAGDLLYLLTSIRNVNKLELGRALHWRPERIASLLPTLNPRHLKICPYDTEAYMHHPHTERFRRGRALHDFALLTPNLESLTISREFQRRLLDALLLQTSEDGVWSSELKSLLVTGTETHALLSLPPTLTSVHFESDTFFSEAALNKLPSTLQRLTFPGSNSECLLPAISCLLPAIAARFHSLESLQYGYQREVNLPPSFAFPQSLTEFALGHIKLMPLALLATDGPLRKSSLEVLKISTSLHAEVLQSGHQASLSVGPFDLAATLPNTLQSLLFRLDMEDMSPRTRHLVQRRYYLSRLPSGLTTLCLLIHLWQPLTTLLQPLHALTRLILDFEYDATIVVCGEVPSSSDSELESCDVSPELAATAPLRFYVRSIPRQLLHLKLTGKAFRNPADAIIDDLPSTLLSLRIEACTLRWALALKNRIHRCVLSISTPIDVWNGESGLELQRQFFGEWTPHLDVQAFQTSVYRFYTELGIHFKLDMKTRDASMGSRRHVEATFPSIKTFTFQAALQPLDAEPNFNHFRLLRDNLPNLTKLVIAQRRSQTTAEVLELSSQFLPRSLTHLELVHQSVSIDRFGLPTSLTFVASNDDYWAMGGLLTFEALPNLTHLDAPRWSFDCSHPGYSIPREMSKLVTRLHGLMDVDVVDFLKNRVNRKTRLNMRVMIFFIPSDGLVDRESLELRELPHESHDKEPESGKIEAALNELLKQRMDPLTSKQSFLDGIFPQKPRMDNEPAEQVGDVVVELRAHRSPNSKHSAAKVLKRFQ